MRRIRTERPDGCEYDDHKADRAVDFFHDHLRHVKGRWAGQPFRLRNWQEVDLREIFGRVDGHGNRVVRQAYLEIPKKNGKSEVAAGVALKLLCADDEAGAEVYAAAYDKDQAGRIYKTAASMVRRDPQLSAMLKPNDTTKTLTDHDWEGTLVALSKESASKHGYNSHGVVFDEVHAQKTMVMWETLTDGAGDARLQPLVYAITTAGVSGESPVAEMLHEDADQILRGVLPCPPDFYPVIYGAEPGDAWDDPDVWHAVNPAMGDFLSVEDTQRWCDRCKRRPEAQNSFKRFRLNQWTGQAERAIDMETWDLGSQPLDVPQLRDSLDAFVGIDLSTRRDMTSVMCVWRDGNGQWYWLPMYWVPEDSLVDRPNIETQRYKGWIEGGHMRTTPGNTVSYDAVRNYVTEELDQKLGIRIGSIALDPMFAGQLGQQFVARGYKVVEFRQTYVNYTEPWNELDAALADECVTHGAHPVLRWNADCLAMKHDATIDGYRPVKPNRLKSRKRIDGIVAGLEAMGVCLRSDVDDMGGSMPGIMVV